MITEARWSTRCPVCGQTVDPAEPTFSIPDLLIEMHQACYRLHLEKHPKCSNICHLSGADRL
jgi:hypothetical protein